MSVNNLLHSVHLLFTEEERVKKNMMYVHSASPCNFIQKMNDELVPITQVKWENQVASGWIIR